MHANSPAPRRQKWHERIVRSGFFLGALLFHLILFLLVATVVIWKTPPPPTYEFRGVAVKLPPPVPPLPPSSGAAASNPQFEPDSVVVPNVTPPSMITAVDSSAFKVDASKMMDQALSHMSQQAPQGSGLSTGGGNGPSGLGSEYGTDTGSGTQFRAHLYDLKQTQDNRPTRIPNAVTFLQAFVKKWDMSILDDFYRSPVTLYATQICTPVTASVMATQAFHVDGVVKPLRWIVIYRAKVTPVESGKYRFIGFADDFMVVRIDKQNVLDASLFETNEGLDPLAKVNEDVGPSPEGPQRPLKCGLWIDMDAATPMDMQVLIGEGPGGLSGFLLMVQKEGDNSPKGDYPVFQLQDTPIPDLSEHFTFSKKKMLFHGSDQ